MRPGLLILTAILLTGCATPPVPSGPMSVVIYHPFNTLTGGRIEAIVEENGSFANGWREGNSSVALYGLLKPAKRGAYEVSFNYQATIARSPSVVDAKSLQATVITRPNDPQPVGDILTKKDGARHYGAADDISFELRVQELAPLGETPQLRRAAAVTDCRRLRQPRFTKKPAEPAGPAGSH